MSYDYSRNDQFLRKINIIILIVVYLFTEYPKDFTLQGKYCSEILCLFADDSSFIPLQKKKSQGQTVIHAKELYQLTCPS